MYLFNRVNIDVFLWWEVIGGFYDIDGIDDYNWLV